jgi:hypothetical protein
VVARNHGAEQAMSSDTAADYNQPRSVCYSRQQIAPFDSRGNRPDSGTLSPNARIQVSMNTAAANKLASPLSSSGCRRTAGLV